VPGGGGTFVGVNCTGVGDCTAVGYVNNGQPIYATSTNSTPGPLRIVTTSLPIGVANQPYWAALQAVGGNPPYTWGYTGTMPAGLTFHSVGEVGVLSGTPHYAIHRTLTFHVRDTRAAGHPFETARATFTVTIG
jgi:hypothetical protein